jgi:hypothetical protein
MIEYNLFRKKENAEKKAKELGCNGSHKMDDGFMPCSSHEEFEKVSNENKGEIEEFIDFDGSFSNSKIPILDPHLHPKKTTDQTVAATRVTTDPMIRGMRFYYGESELAEVDMSGAFGYEETKDMTADETIEFLEKEFGMDSDTAKDRALEMGKSEERDEKSPYKDKKNFVGRPVLQEKELGEDMLTKKVNTLDIQPNGQASDILIRNAKALKKLAKKEGVSIRELFKMISRE